MRRNRKSATVFGSLVDTLTPTRPGPRRTVPAYSPAADDKAAPVWCAKSGRLIVTSVSMRMSFRLRNVFSARQAIVTLSLDATALVRGARYATPIFLLDAPNRLSLHHHEVEFAAFSPRGCMVTAPDGRSVN